MIQSIAQNIADQYQTLNLGGVPMTIDSLCIKNGAGKFAENLLPAGTFARYYFEDGSCVEVTRVGIRVIDDEHE